MNPNKALWEKGDFTKIAAFMRQSGEAVVASLGIRPPLRVLDLGCGDGTTAVPIARLGHQARRPYRDGQLDSQRSHVVRVAAPEDQHVVHAATP